MVLFNAVVKVFRPPDSDQLFNPDLVTGTCGVWLDTPANTTEIRNFATLPLVALCADWKPTGSASNAFLSR